ncbi:TIR domain-containing protein [Methylobacterium sp. Leaf99]|uniref:TIR domain-containing protein n=1 Tax=Methylobacterium sp. Leaf99 TaxID=1736251 RepID=UPI000AF3287C|nr:nucleotide-binding protein [Methylobacterium sp. Leaf99]
MEGAKNIIQELIHSGERFNFQNFASHSSYGYPMAYTIPWIAWKTRVSGAIERLFEANSPASRLIKSAQAEVVIGNDADHFERAKSCYIGALTTALEIIEKDTFGELIVSSDAASGPRAFSNKIFVVHGHDNVAKQELEIILAEMGLEPVVLHRQPDGGRVLIEKFEHYSDVGYAFILMTPDEIAYLAEDEVKSDADRRKERRARPNVIFEFGFFVGRLGRGRTCCLYRGNVTIPSDLSGLIYKKFEKTIEEVAYGIRRELIAAGYVLK